MDAITLDDLANPAGLSAALDRTGVSGRELARRLDVTPMWVSRRATGQTPITLQEASRILEALNR
jgi:transcriptional regulator with XRE-family HTH domain